MIYGSVCSGIEAASCAWNPLGWKAAFLSEIEPFPRAVLAHHYPETPLHGDFTTIKANDYAAIDLLVGGTPCQSFSVAGLRKGLDDPRGNLMLEFGALAQRLTPRWIVWENVPGVLSSNGGRDFGTFLGMLAELGYGFAYRVLDAQYFGVAQRRRRVFVVGYLGDWRRAAAVLFEQDCMRGNPAPSREAGKDVAGTISARTQGGGGLGSDFEMAGGTVPTIAHSLRGEGFDASEDGTGRGTPLVPVSFVLQHAQIGRKDSAGPQGKGWQEECSFTLDSRPCADAVVFDTTQITSAANRSNPKPGDPCHTLSKGAHAPAVSVSLRGREGGATAELGDEVGNCLRASGGGGDKAHVLATSAVRRLTPVECERLQGFRDDYTLVTVRGKPAADGPRYKALGNSMAVPVIAWLGRRIEFVDSIPVAVKVAA